MRSAAFTLVMLILSAAGRAQEDPPLTRPVPTPKELWQEFSKTLPPLELRRTGDRIVTSEVDSRVRLRRVDVTFVSQMVFGKKLVHRSVIFLPTDPELLEDKGRRGKVVIVGSIAGAMQQSFLVNYGHAIATRNRYPVMILPNPGSTPDRPHREWSIRNLWAKGVPRVPTNKYFFRLAVVYLRAMDVFAGVLGLEPEALRAVIGGHSKRAPSAYNAAAIRPDQVAGVVFMGMEGRWRWRPDSPWLPTHPLYVRRFVRCPTLYLGATNEDGYSMFNVTHNQALLDKDERWTVSMVPNYRHAAESEQQFVIWRMWVAHVFDGRPVARISDVSHEDTPQGTRFKARVECLNRIIQVRAWYTYCDDVPLWRDLVWYPVVMRPEKDGLYVGYERGRTPDAWMVEVHDAAGGFRGYVTSCPQNITGKPVKERRSRGSRSRQWREKKVDHR